MNDYVWEADVSMKNQLNVLERLDKKKSLTRTCQINVSKASTEENAIKIVVSERPALKQLGKCIYVPVSM